MKSTIVSCVTCLFFALVVVGSAQASGNVDQDEFSRIMDMTLTALAEATDRQLVEKYPDEDWSSWGFPAYVTEDKKIESSYRVAVKDPALLGKANISDKRSVVPCYCTCQRFGHANLLYCFLKDGVTGGEYDEHASQCGVCMRQAFLAFLWSELGASHDEIIAGMEKKFAPLIKMQKEGAL